MNDKKLSEEELKTSTCQQVHTLENKLSKGEFSIEDIGDYIPGNVMMQDLSTFTNIYMNKSGCDILMHSMEELEALGPEYYKKFFPQEEMENFLVPNLLRFLERQDVSEVLSFFQRVRAGENADYKWYFTTSKLYREKPDETPHKIIYIATEVNSFAAMSGKLNRLLEETEFMKKNFKKFALLTKREKEIIKLLVEGKNGPEIADMLSVSHFTINTHRRNIHRKLEISNFSQLLKYALAFDLIGEQ